MPVPIQFPRQLIGGTVNGEGVLHMRAGAVGGGTVLAGIARLVREAQTSKAPVQVGGMVWERGAGRVWVPDGRYRGCGKWVT